RGHWGQGLRRLAGHGSGFGLARRTGTWPFTPTGRYWWQDAAPSRKRAACRKRSLECWLLTPKLGNPRPNLSFKTLLPRVILDENSTLHWPPKYSSAGTLSMNRNCFRGWYCD